MLENVPLLEEEDTEGTGEVSDKMEDEEEGIIGVNPADTKEAGVKLLEVSVYYIHTCMYVRIMCVSIYISVLQ